MSNMDAQFIQPWSKSKKKLHKTLQVDYLEGDTSFC